ncbi:MAG: flagellar assembly protein FliH [Treponema sp.]|nr:flagellar assembly protein FliH [Treponema sp.]
MAKNLFQPNEVKRKDGEFKLGLVHEFVQPQEEVEVEEVPVYTGPTIEDIQKEIDEYKAKWESEKQIMLEEAQAQADEIVNNAKEAAFAEVKRQSDQAQEIKVEAEQKAQEIIKAAQEEASQIREKAENEKIDIQSDAKNEGFKIGREEGYKVGEEEVNRLIDRSHKILEAVMSRREEILNETEQQIVELVLLMTRKVIKIISENQRQVVVANILQALKKVRGRGEVTLRVNLQDVNLSTQHIQDFIKQVENIKGITVIEDSSVDKGGCIVETDFGAIDARISSQLSELESKILEISPIKTVKKADSVNPN